VTTSPPASRTYRGLLPDERAAQRRARLIDAAMTLCADRRTADVPVAEVCRAARVGTRQFYELFDEREELFVAVYAHARDIALRHTLDAVDAAGTAASREARAQALMRHFFHAPPDSELARALTVLFAVGATSPALRQLRAESVVAAGGMLAARLGISVAQAGVAVSAFVGALEQHWLDVPIAPTDEVIATMAALLSADPLSAGG
jgi:AcrR family transcriptional regulator